MSISDPEVMNYVTHMELTYFVAGMFCGMAVEALIILLVYGFYFIKKIDNSTDNE